MNGYLILFFFRWSNCFSNRKFSFRPNL